MQRTPENDYKGTGVEISVVFPDLPIASIVPAMDPSEFIFGFVVTESHGSKLVFQVCPVQEQHV